MAKPTVVLPEIKVAKVSSLFDLLPSPTSSARPLTFEDLNQAYGFVLYRTQIEGGKSGMLKVSGLKDYALIYINGKRVAILDRRLKQDSVMVNLPKGEVWLEILVENLGRINFGPYLLQNKKGITDKVSFDGAEVKNWKMFGLPLDHTPKTQVKVASNVSDAPVIKTGVFNLNKLADTYLDMSDWGKGIVWINGNNLGRYWAIGPQQTLYVPAEWLKKGSNRIVVLELIKTEQSIVKTTKYPVLDRIQN